MSYFLISPIQAIPPVQEVGHPVMVIADFRNLLTGALAAPATTISIEITGPDGSVTTYGVAYTNMTADTTTGRYYYVFVTTAATSPGVYIVRCRCVDGGHTSKSAPPQTTFTMVTAP